VAKRKQIGHSDITGDKGIALIHRIVLDTQFDGGLPITIRAAHEVGALLKYTGPSDKIPPHYSFFM
jgi:hypothetical protein